VIARTTDRFRKSFAKLPDPIKEKARKAYALWRQDPYHSSLNYKQIHEVRPIYSVRIGSIELSESKKMKHLFGFGLDHMKTTII
jgi:hypothetical protein